MTIKYGKGYEETWAVFKGSVDEVRADIIAYFGVDGASVAGLTLSELVVNVTNIAHGKGNAAAMLGATVINSTTVINNGADEAQADPWATAANTPAEAKPEANPNEHLYAAVSAAGDTDSLKRVWAENQAAFALDEALLAAWKAKGKALSTGS